MSINPSTKGKRKVYEPPTRPTEPVHDWEKDEEELDLEARLFGGSRKGKSKGLVDSRDDLERSGLESVDDDELFTVDAPIYEGSSGSSSGGMDEHDEEEEGGESDVTQSASGVIGDDEDGINDEESEVSEEEGNLDMEEDGSNSDSDSDSAPSLTFHDTHPDHTHPDHTVRSTSTPIQDPNEGIEETGDNAPTVQLPPGLIELPHSPPPGPSGLKRKKGGDVNGSQGDDGKGKGKMPLWVDEADENVQVDMESDKRMRKLARGKQGDQTNIPGKELEKRLREQFERLHPRPEWASNRQKPPTGTPSLSSLLSTNKSFIAPSLESIISGSGSTRIPLPPGTLDLKRLRNANAQNPTTGEKQAAGVKNGVLGVEWHPSEKVGVLAVIGGDKRVRIFNIDGHSNPTLLTLHTPSLPLLKATFHPSGSTLLLTGPRPYYYTYDLTASRILRSPRNLFGSQPSPTSPNSLNRHSFSPDGSLLAVAARRGVVSVLEWSGMGVGGVVAELKSGRGGTVAAMTWGEGGKVLNVLGGRDGAEVESWNVGERKVLGKWKDDRAFGGSLMKNSKDGLYTAVGSTTGIVNLYTSDSIRPSTSEFKTLNPEPLKSLEHLTTPITDIAWHPSSQLMCTASDQKKDSIRMYHLPSGTAYSNWPTQNTPIGRANCVSFSSGGEFFTVGNHRGQVLLYNVKHFGDLTGMGAHR